MSDQLETLRHLQNMASQRFFQRRLVEWRFAFTFWALTGAAGLAARVMEPYWAATTVASVAGGLAALFHVLFQWRYAIGPAKRDWAWGIDLERRIRDAIDEPTEGVPDRCDYRTFWAHGWQVAVTFIVAIIGILSVTLRVGSP